MREDILYPSAPAGRARIVDALCRPTGLAAIFGLLLLAVLAIAGPRFTPYSSNLPDYSAMGVTTPTWAHPCGTDFIGKDICSGVLAGYRYDLVAIAEALGVTLLVGAGIGAVAAWSGRRAGTAIFRLTTMFHAVPPLILPIVSAMVGSIVFYSTANYDWAPEITFVFLGWPAYARLGYAWIVARRAGNGVISSASQRPHLAALFLTQLAVDAPRALLTIIWLGLLNLGPQWPTVEWGEQILLQLASDSLSPPPPFPIGTLIFPFLAPATSVLILIAISRTVRRIVMPDTLSSIWSVEGLAHSRDLASPLLARPNAGTSIDCAQCGRANPADMQRCAHCESVLVRRPAAAGKYIRPSWQLMLFMVISLGVYVIPCCYRYYRFLNAAWVAQESPKRRLPWARCLTLLVPIYNSYAFYRLAADIDDVTGRLRQPSPGSLGLAFLLTSFPFFTVAPRSVGINPSFALMLIVVTQVSSAGRILPLQVRINKFFGQGSTGRPARPIHGWTSSVGVALGLLLWGAIFVYVLGRTN
jgi:peptide/nickel transport system permease protein